jgi:hypothetical protein
MDGLACPIVQSVAHDYSDEGIEFPARHYLVLSCSSGRWRFIGGYATPGLGCLWRY